MNVSEFAIVTDLLRLLAVPAFGYAAWHDLDDRRVPNSVWPPLLALGGACLLADLLLRPGDGLLLHLGAGVAVAGVAYLFWLVGGIGGADVKALFALAVVYPNAPFVLAVLANTAAVTLLVPVALVAINLRNGDIAPQMFGARVRYRNELAGAHGSLLHSGLDLDALQTYLRWRSVGIGELADLDGWRAEAFVEEAEAYGADAATVRAGLDAVAGRDRVWVDPGLPLLAFLFVGLVTAIGVGNVVVVLL